MGFQDHMDFIFELPASNYPIGTNFMKTRFLLVPTSAPLSGPPYGVSGPYGLHFRTPRIELPNRNQFHENSISIGSHLSPPLGTPLWGFGTIWTSFSNSPHRITQ